MPNPLSRAEFSQLTLNPEKSLREIHNGRDVHFRCCATLERSSRPLFTVPAIEGDEGAVTRTQSSRSRQWETTEEMYDEQL